MSVDEKHVRLIEATTDLLKIADDPHEVLKMTVRDFIATYGPLGLRLAMSKPSGEVGTVNEANDDWALEFDRKKPVYVIRCRHQTKGTYKYLWGGDGIRDPFHWIDCPETAKKFDTQEEAKSFIVKQYVKRPDRWHLKPQARIMPEEWK